MTDNIIEPPDAGEALLYRLQGIFEESDAALRNLHCCCCILDEFDSKRSPSEDSYAVLAYVNTHVIIHTNNLRDLISEGLSAVRGEEKPVHVREALASNLKVSVDKLSAEDPLSVLSDEDQEFLKNIRNASPAKQREVRKILFKAAMITGGKALAEDQGKNGPHHPEPDNAA
jgi:hypothetical protein